MNMKFPFSEKSKMIPIQADIILLLLLDPVSSVQILKEVKSLFVYSGQGRACSGQSHVKLSLEFYCQIVKYIG